MKATRCSANVDSSHVVRTNLVVDSCKKHIAAVTVALAAVDDDVSLGMVSTTLWFFIYGLFSLRWGCRKHFVSGCWHSSGRDRGRYPRECWLSTLGVLHPGVPVMWYGHIRDLSPTAEGCMGGRLPNVTLLHWAQQK